MGLFRRRSKADDEPVDPNERSPHLGLSFFQVLADTHGGDYDGWEASV